MERKAYTVREVAEMLNVSRIAVYNMIKEGRIRAVNIGVGNRELRIPKNALEEFLGGAGNADSQQGESRSEPACDSLLSSG